MATELGVDLPIRSTFDPKGSDEAARRLRDIEKRLEGIEAQAKKTGGGVKEMAGAFAGLAGVAVLIQQAREALESLNRQEQAMNALSLAAEKAGQSNEKVTKGVTEMADALKRAAGIDDDETIPAMIRAYQATGNLETALTRARLAADVSVGGLLKFGEANALVEKAANGQTEELKKFGIVIDQNLPKKEQARRAMLALEKQFGGSAEKAKGNTVELAKLRTKYEDIRDAIVQRLVPSVLWLVNAFGLFGDMAASAALTAWTAMSGLWDALKQLGTAAKAFFSGDFGVAKAEYAKIAEITKRTQAEIAEIQEAATSQYEKRFLQSTETVKLGHKDVRNAINQDLSSMSAEAEAFLDRYMKNIVWVRHKLGPELLKAQQEANAKAAEADREASQKSAETAKTILGNLAAFHADIARFRTETAVGLQAQHSARMAQLDTEERLALKKLEADKISTEATVAAVRERYARERILLGEATARAEQEQILTVANTALGAAAAIFGDHKEIAIAQAIVNTYEGASKALAQGGIYGTILAAVVIAAGLAQVAKISSTNPSRSGGGPSTTGRGFDDPSNDAAARMGGARWANDMVREWTSGVSAGWAAGLTGGRNSSTVSNSSTVDQSRHYSVEFQLPGVLDVHSVEQGKQLRRTLDSVGRQVDDGRILSRRA